MRAGLVIIRVVISRKAEPILSGSGLAAPAPSTVWRLRKSDTIRWPRSATSAMVRVTSAGSGRRNWLWGGSGVSSSMDHHCHVVRRTPTRGGPRRLRRAFTIRARAARGFRARAWRDEPVGGMDSSMVRAGRTRMGLRGRSASVLLACLAVGACGRRRERPEPRGDLARGQRGERRGAARPARPRPAFPESRQRAATAGTSLRPRCGTRSRRR